MILSTGSYRGYFAECQFELALHQFSLLLNKLPNILAKGEQVLFRDGNSVILPIVSLQNYRRLILEGICIKLLTQTWYKWQRKE